MTPEPAPRHGVPPEADPAQPRLQALAAASVAICSTLALPEVLRVVTERARDIVGSHMSVTSLTVDETWAQAITHVSLSDKYAAWRDCDDGPDGSGIDRVACGDRRSVRLTQAELEAHPAWRGFGAAAGTHPPLRGWLAAPLIGRDGRTIGLLQLSDRYEGDFTADDEAVLVQLAQLASVAIRWSATWPGASTPTTRWPASSWTATGSAPSPSTPTAPSRTTSSTTRPTPRAPTSSGRRCASTRPASGSSSRGTPCWRRWASRATRACSCSTRPAALSG